MTDDLDLNPPVDTSLRPPRAGARPAPERPPMPEAPAPVYDPYQDDDTSRSVSPALLAVLMIAVAAAAVFGVWYFVLRDTGSSGSTASANAPKAASVTDLATLAATLGHPIFWLGPRAGDTYELTRTASGKVYVRYLPAGAGVGAAQQYTTVATYPFPGAYAAVTKAAAAQSASSAKLANGGLAVVNRLHPESVYVAYPGVDYQVEVFDPTPNAAMQMLQQGRLANFGQLKVAPPPSTTPPAPVAKAVSAHTLKALAASLDHPIYWAGRSAGSTYELTQTSSGKVYIRYLPAGVKAGSSHGYLTVATYPFPKGYAALKRSAKGNAAHAIRLRGGGIAVVDAAHPNSIYVAFPKTGVQVEVFDPSAAKARRIVSSGKIAAVR